MHALILTSLPQDDTAVVVFASQAAAERWRDVYEENGGTTMGLVRVVNRVDALLTVTTGAR